MIRKSQKQPNLQLDTLIQIQKKTLQFDENMWFLKYFIITLPNIQKQINMPELGFTSRLKIPVIGYMQAVSDDGRVIIYRNEENFLVYFYDGQEITEQVFHLDYISPMVKEKYYEEAIPLKEVYTRLFNQTIKIYLIHPHLQEITMVSIGNYNKDQPKIYNKGFSSPIYDVFMHPTEDCLAVLENSDIHFIFQPDTPDQTIFFDPQNWLNQTVLNGQLQIIKDESAIYYYIIYVQNFDDYHEWYIRKYQELTFLKSYNWYLHEYFYDIYICDQFQHIEYNEEHKIFFLTSDYVDDITRYRTQLCIDDELRQLQMTGEATLDGFYAFSQNKSKLIFGHYQFLQTNTNITFIREVCLYTFTVTSKKIKLSDDKEECLKGMIDRVGSWKMGEQFFMLTQEDQYLTLRQGFNQELDTIKALSFSAKMKDVLIVDTFGELQFLEWGQVQGNNLQNHQTTEELSFAILIGMIILGLLLLIVLGILVHTCYRLKKNNPEKKRQDKKNPKRIMNQKPPPYIHTAQSMEKLANPFISKNFNEPIVKSFNPHDQKDDIVEKDPVST